MKRLLPLAALALAPPAPATATAVTIAAMKDSRRVLIVAAPKLADPRLWEQRRTLASWRHGGHARDLSIVEVVGGRVRGAADRSKVLRRQWHLPPGDFQVVLVGKDGHEALRSVHPVTAATLARTIDAMPMRRAGQR